MPYSEKKPMPARLTSHLFHAACRFRSALWICLLTGVVLPAAASAAPRLRCQLEQGGESRALEFAPVADPYSVEAADIRGNFRFKAVVIGDAQHVEYVKLYIYYLSDTQPVLLHAAKYLAPAAQIAPTPAALTGVNYLYSPRLGRELQYGCALFEVTS